MAEKKNGNRGGWSVYASALCHTKKEQSEYFKTNATSMPYIIEKQGWS